MIKLYNNKMVVFDNINNMPVKLSSCNGLGLFVLKYKGNDTFSDTNRNCILFKREESIEPHCFIYLNKVIVNTTYVVSIKSILNEKEQFCGIMLDNVLYDVNRKLIFCYRNVFEDTINKVYNGIKYMSPENAERREFMKRFGISEEDLG